MDDYTTQRRVPPAAFVSIVVGVVIAAVVGVSLFEAASTSEARDARSVASAGVVAVSGGEVAAGSVRDQLAQTAQHQDVGLMAMAPLYSPAVVEVQVERGEDAPEQTVAGFFVGPGRVAVPRSAITGAVRGEVTLDVGRSFEVQRIVAEAPEVDLALISIDIPSELLRGLQVAFLEPLPGESLLAIGRAEAPGMEDARHPVASVTVERVRVDDSVEIELEESIPEWALGAPLLNDTGKLGGYVARDQEGKLRVFGSERLLRLDPLPGLTLTEWTGGQSIESTRPPPETEDLWAEIRNLPRPEGFDPAPKEFSGYDVRPAKIERVDGDLVLDERFTVTGSGTAEDPYILPWALMMSASETFNPSRGKLALPERVTMFDGKHVRFQGNLAIPFAERFVSELLLMQHPWDGCCLGVPPTPYDAIEVALAAPIEQRPQYGVLQGRLRVDPFVRGQWLYGMYLMEGASLSRPPSASEDN